MTAEEFRAAYGSGRITRPRALIAETARSLPGAFSASELAGAVRSRDSRIGLATVYRALAALEASGWLTRAGERDGAALFVRCGAAGHHHHLVCTQCGHVEHAPCPVEPALAEAARASGFRITEHELTLRGICGACDDKARP